MPQPSLARAPGDRCLGKTAPRKAPTRRWRARLWPVDAALSLERRRRRNREAMQRLRERQQLAIEELRCTARNLDATHRDLLQQLDLSAPFLALPLPSTHVEEAKQCTQSLLHATTQLQKQINDDVKWEDRVALLLSDVENNTEKTRPAPVGNDFRPPLRLSAAMAAELMVLHHTYRAAVDRKWRCATRAPVKSLFFGCEYWHHRFSKLLRNVSAHAVSERAWRNAQQMISYRSRLPRQHVVQHINDNTFVFARWGLHSQRRHRAVYHVRFRVEDADGSIGIAMQTLPSYTDNSAIREPAAVDLEGDDVCLFIKLTPVHDTESGEEHCVVEYSGRIHFGDDAHLNAMELVISLARWEEVNTAQSPVRLLWS